MDDRRRLLAGRHPAGAARLLLGHPLPLEGRRAERRRTAVHAVPAAGESVTFTSDGRALLYGTEGKDSPVWRAPLDDAQLPDTVEPLRSPTPVPSAPSDSSAPASPTSGAAAPPSRAEGKDAPASTGDKVLGVAFLAAIAVAVFGLRRKKREG